METLTEPAERYIKQRHSLIMETLTEPAERYIKQRRSITAECYVKQKLSPNSSGGRASDLPDFTL